MNKVYLTGIGVLSCAGNNLDDIWKNINSESGLKLEDIKLPLELPKVFNNSITRRMDRFSQMILIACKQSIDNSNLLDRNYDPNRIGTILTSSYGPLNSMLNFGRNLFRKGIDMVSPTTYISTVQNSCLGNICISFNFKGVSTMLQGSNAIAYACDLLNSNKADAILCGGIEEFSLDLKNVYDRMNYETNDERYICKPLDKYRNGIRITEGAISLVLENENTSASINPICEILGWGMSSSCNYIGTTTSSTDYKLFVDTINHVLKASDITYKDIDGIFMAASGSKYGDLAEAKAIHEVFKEKSTSIPVTAIKGSIGEMFGADLNFNVAIAALSLNKGEIPPTNGCTSLDPEIGLNIVCEKANKNNYRYFLVNSYDISGCISSIILKSTSII